MKIVRKDSVKNGEVLKGVKKEGKQFGKVRGGVLGWVSCQGRQVFNGGKKPIPVGP